MFIAHFYNLSLSLEAKERKLVEVSGETALDFHKQIKNMGWGYEIRNARNCSIDGIKVKPGEFCSVIQQEVDIHAKRRLKEIPPIKHLGFTDLDVSMYGLYRVGKEIFVRRPPNEAEFFKVLERTNEGAIKTLYHGTNATNIQSIIMSGLHASKGGAFGRGLYVGPWERLSTTPARAISGIANPRSTKPCLN